MTLLLDTHVFLWWRLGSRRLGAGIRRRIANAPIVLVSAASAWEIAIKQRLGKIELDESFAAMVEDSRFEPLPVTIAHAERTALLPPHHADPFDRMLIAQALSEGATLVTHDRQCEPYDIPVLWV